MNTYKSKLNAAISGLKINEQKLFIVGISKIYANIYDHIYDESRKLHPNLYKSMPSNSGLIYVSSVMNSYLNGGCDLLEIKQAQLKANNIREMSIGAHAYLAAFIDKAAFSLYSSNKNPMIEPLYHLVSNMSILTETEIEESSYYKELLDFLSKYCNEYSFYEMRGDGVPCDYIMD